MTSGQLAGDPGLRHDTVSALRAALRGDVVLPGDDAYESARRVWNGMIDRHPAIVVRCAGTSDVVEAIRFARREALTVAVRGGGHNVAGNATCDDGLVIDLTPMQGVHVDPARQSARAQGGLTWGEFDKQTQAHGLATTGGLVTTTGIAGFTLGGGIGWLMRKHGLACDNLLAAELVTAEGGVIQVSEAEHPELMWALRGGGGNFGVVTEFEFRLHPVSHIYGGLLGWPAEAAGDVLRAWRDWIEETPDELCTLAAFLYAPPEPFVPPEVVGSPIFGIACFHLGPEGRAEEDLRPLRDLGPALDVLGLMPYQAVQGMFDAGAPRGSRNYWRSGYLGALTDPAIDELLAHAAALPKPMGQLHLHQMGGAMSRVPAGATAFGSREAPILVNYLGLWMDPSEDEANIAWVRRTSEAMEPYGTGQRYVNFLADEGEAGVRSAYEAETLSRLAAVKAQYDPTNFFHLNQNIEPAPSSP
jgi:FAD/FMN-containing dehydrogenase